MAFDPKSKTPPPGSADGPGGKEPVAALLLKLKGEHPDGDGSGPPGGGDPGAGGPPGAPGGQGDTDSAQADLEHGASLLAQAVSQGNPQAIAQAFMAMFMVAQQVTPTDDADDTQSGPPAPGESEE